LRQSARKWNLNHSARKNHRHFERSSPTPFLPRSFLRTRRPAQREIPLRSNRIPVRIPSRSPLSILLDALSYAKFSDLANQRERQGLLQRKLDRPSRRVEFRKLLCERLHRRRRGIKPNVVFVRRKRNQNPLIRKRRHPPFHPLRRSRSRLPNARPHLPQFLPRLLRRRLNVLSNARRSRFLCSHGFLFYRHSRPHSIAFASSRLPFARAPPTIARDTIPAMGVIVKNPDILGGTPVFRGTRVPIQTLFDYLEGGETLEDFLEGFPTVSRESAVAALEEAKHLLLARP